MIGGKLGLSLCNAYVLQLPPEDTRDHVEIAPEGGVIAEELTQRIKEDGGFALVADYGHNGDKSDTFRVSTTDCCRGPIFCSTYHAYCTKPEHVDG